MKSYHLPNHDPSSVVNLISSLASFNFSNITLGITIQPPTANAPKFATATTKI